jgi:polyisoprenoid-binding protein YceI
MKTIFSLLAMHAMASAGTMDLDSQKSWLKLDCKATGHSWTARVKTFTATVSGDDASLSPSAAQVKWKFSDIDSAEADRDKKMLDWLNATKNPTGSWKMTDQWKDSAGQQYVKGPLTIAGISKDVVIPVTAKKSGNVISLDGEVWIDTTDFSLPVIKMLVLTVNPKVKISFHLEGPSK